MFYAIAAAKAKCKVTLSDSKREKTSLSSKYLKQWKDQTVEQIRGAVRWVAKAV